MSGRQAQSGAQSAAHTTVISCSVEELGRQLKEAFQAGFAEGRLWLATAEQTLKNREEAIHRRDTFVLELYAKVDSLTQKIGEVAEKTAQVVLIDAQKEVALERLKSRATVEKELLEGAKALVPVVRSLLPAGATPTVVREVLLELFSDEDLCDRVTARVGLERFKEFSKWAGGLL